MSDAEVCAKLSELDGIGVWTAEMLMLHSLQRPDVLSFGDLAVQRGLRSCIITAKSPAPCSRNTAAAILLTAVLPVFIYGRCRQVRWRV